MQLYQDIHVKQGGSWIDFNKANNKVVFHYKNVQNKCFSFKKFYFNS